MKSPFSPAYVCFFSAVFFLISCQERSGDAAFDEKALRIHQGVLTVDTHADTPSELDHVNLLGGHSGEVPSGKVDFPRMQKGGLDAIFFAVYAAQGPRVDSAYRQVQKKALATFYEIHELLEKYNDLAELARSPADAERLEKLGKRAVFIGIENGYAIGKDPALLGDYYGLGARYITLCHSGNNDICDSSGEPDNPEHGGLSDFGREVVREMNRLGMMIDVSHISDAAFYDVVKASVAPVIASHSCCRALCDNPRNLTDEMLLKLKENGGVIQVTLVSSFVRTRENEAEYREEMEALSARYGDPDTLKLELREHYQRERSTIRGKYAREYATVSDLVDHIDHVVETIGIDHVGIGSDFDGGGGLIDCTDVAEMGNITKELLKRGYTRRQIAKIWGGNLMRVFREVEELADRK